MFTTFAAGATAPLSGAPALPTINIVPANYPALDVTPPTNTPQVQQWLKELDLSKVPQLSVTKDGSCASDPAAAAGKWSGNVELNLSHILYHCLCCRYLSLLVDLRWLCSRRGHQRMPGQAELGRQLR